VSLTALIELFKLITDAPGFHVQNPVEAGRLYGVIAREQRQDQTHAPKYALSPQNNYAIIAGERQFAA
jgi:hypothetical protein